MNKSLTDSGASPCFTPDALYEQYADTVYRVAFLRTKNSSDAEDVLQEVFLRYIRRAPEFMSAEHAKAWLIRAAINCSNSLLTSAWYRRTEAADDNLRDEIVERSEVYPLVLALPLKYRTVVHLHYYEGYKVEEIARITGAKESTVKSWLFRARAELRRQLGEEID